MKNRFQILLVLAALSIAIAGGLFYYMQARRTAEVAVVKQNPQNQKKEVLVAATDVAVGQIVTMENFIWQPWLQDALIPSYITREQPDKIKKTVGSLVIAPIIKGEPLKMTSIYVTGDTADKSTLSILLKPGMLGVAIPLRQVINAAQLYRPGDMIDIILPRRLDNNNENDEEIILNNIKIIAVDDKFHLPRDSSLDKIPNILTVEISPEQAEELAVSIREGSLVITQHGLNDMIYKPSPTLRKITQRRIIIIKGQSGGNSVEVPNATP